jgi:hypothetical protein
MWIYIILNIVFSIIIILLGHYIWIYLKDNYSVKKTKDLVGSQIQKYKTILNDIQHAENTKSESYEMIEYNSTKLPVTDSNIHRYNTDYMDLKNDLEAFLQEIT